LPVKTGKLYSTIDINFDIRQSDPSRLLVTSRPETASGYERPTNLRKINNTIVTADDWTARFKALNDDSVKGLLRSIGDAGNSPSNASGKTLLKWLYDIYNSGVPVSKRTESKTSRTISSPATETDYFVPESGNIDISNYRSATVYVYADQAVDVVVEASFDGGTTFRGLNGYSIDSSSFDTSNFNVIKLYDIDLELIRVKITTGTTAPSSIECYVVYKT